MAGLSLSFYRNWLVGLVLIWASIGFLLSQQLHAGFFPNNSQFSDENEPAMQPESTPAIAQTINIAPETDETTVKLITAELKPAMPPKSVQHDVPFTSQAPFADWDDQRQQDGCEEASLLMAYRWTQGETQIAKQDALNEIIALSAFEEGKFGYFNDTSAADTAQLMKDYFKYDNVEVFTEVTLDGIKSELARGHIVIVPADGRKLNNPNFTNGGPERHKLVIIGYDDEAGEFITNDPGTRRGKQYRYDYATLMTAILDYPSGHKVPITTQSKAMIVVRPQNH